MSLSLILSLSSPPPPTHNLFLFLSLTPQMERRTTPTQVHAEVYQCHTCIYEEEDKCMYAEEDTCMMLTIHSYPLDGEQDDTEVYQCRVKKTKKQRIPHI